METMTKLSRMECRIIECIAAGDSTTSIAQKLYLSRQGVEYHVSRLLQRMRVPNRPALVAKAYSMGIFDSSAWPPKVDDEL
ncbi:helix-turn-helix transcriptional regulator [Dactylosporangium roseum]|uniref:Helix-turn-helix transcriptional regulator n=1 Tax=Dactylosporangium roseum TaxID=47989 RepID=A0ABY5YYE1_9ACTN|nr:helix-turn-helix transcriptional regulator [Dactylosporangium roseum]UWZ34764.1 helix-turn-helix transcriptional regulator [Dactylosporangium roseum]